MAVVVKRKKPIGATFVGAFFGLIGGIGLGIYLQELGTIAPSNKAGLAVPIAGLLLGIFAGVFGGRKPKTPAVTA